MAGLLPPRHPRPPHYQARAAVCELAFRGQYEYTLDAKNRLTIPPKFRAPLAGGAVLAKSLDSCISIWTTNGWGEFTERALSSRDPFSAEARQLERYFHASSFD